MIAALAALVLAATPTEVNRYTVVVGHNAPDRDDRPPLHYADDDAARFFELLSPLSMQAFLLTAFDQDSQGAFSDLIPTARPPTLAELTSVARTVRKHVAEHADRGERAEVYFVYAGHGEVDDGAGYLTLADGRLTRAHLERLFLSGSRAAVTHVIIDACKSFFMASGRGPGGTRRPLKIPLVNPRLKPRVGYVLSTSSDAESHEWSAVSGGVFSHEVRSGLAGAADANRDGAIDYHELSAFIAVANEAIPYPKYRPAVFIQPPATDREVVLYEPDRLSPAGRLTLDAGLSGRVSVTDQRGYRYADVHKAVGAPLAFALLGPFRYQVEWRGEHYSVSSTVAEVALAELRPEPGRLIARGEVHRAYEHLFERPFGPEVVRGFRLADARTIAAEPAAEPDTTRANWSLGLLGGGAAALGLGLVLNLVATETYGDATVAAQTDRRGIESRADAFQGGAIAAYATGGIAIATGIVLQLVGD